MSIERLKLLVVGVGGQGVLTIARVLGDAAVQAGIEVVVGQLHGMAQRGGSVEATVVMGGLHSSFIEQADLVLGLEPLEVLRALARIGPQTRVVMNRGRVVPFPLAMQGRPYPEIEAVRARIDAVTPHVDMVDGPALLAEIGEQRSLNLLMLGVLSGLGPLPVEEATVRGALARRSPGHMRAYEQGLRAGSALA